MTRVFISYRRDDSAAYAGRLYDRLTAHFGEGQVFMDIDQIEPGEDFVEAIQRTVSACETAVILIGKGWLNAADSEGKRRLDDPDDFVRLEVAAALERRIKVLPVLVGGASMPKSPQLPEPLAPLARRNAIEVSDTRFHTDVNRLVEAIEKTLAAVPAATPAPQRSAPTEPTPETVNVSASAPSAQAPAPPPRREIPSPIPEPRALEPTVAAAPAASGDRDGSASAPKRKLVAAGAGLVAVVAAIGFAFSSRTSSPPREAAPTAAVDSRAPIKIRGENGFGSGDRRTAALQAFAKTLSDGSSARIQFEVLPSGPFVKSLQSLGQSDWGAADAVWVTSAHLYGQHPAFALVSEPPFGPDPAKYVQWRQSPKVKAIVTELYEKVGVMGVLCGVTGPNADLWSRKKIAQPADLKGLKTRAVGLTNDILKAAGMSAYFLPAGEIYPALNNGVLDAIQLSDLPLGVGLGLPNIAKYLYFPGSLAPASGVELVFRRLSWDGLVTLGGRAAVEQACQRNIEAMLAAGDAVNRDALTLIAGKGVTVAPLPAPVLAELQTAWMRVAIDKSTDPLFSRLFDTVRPPPGKTL